MKIIDKGGRSEGVFRCYWLRLFSFGKDEAERALFSFERTTDRVPLFCVRVQLGGDCFAEFTVHLFHNSFNFTIWSV